MAYPSALAAISRRALGGMLLALTGAPAAASPLEAWFAPRARLWARWTPHDPGSTATVDHGAWDRLLGRWVRAWPDGTHRVPYAEMGREERRALHDYLASLAAVPVGRLRRAEQFACWVNLYNALTMKVVLDAYPVTSIRDIDISPGLLADGPWGARLVVVEGEALCRPPAPPRGTTLGGDDSPQPGPGGVPLRLAAERCPLKPPPAGPGDGHPPGPDPAWRGDVPDAS